MQTNGAQPLIGNSWHIAAQMGVGMDLLPACPWRESSLGFREAGTRCSLHPILTHWYCVDFSYPSACFPETRVIQKRYEMLKATFNERTRRLWAAAEAKAAGPGAIAMVARATEASHGAILQGIKELDNPPQDRDPNRIRRPGGGAPTLVAKDPTVKTDLDRLIDSLTRGDPESPLRWT